MSYRGICYGQEKMGLSPRPEPRKMPASPKATPECPGSGLKLTKLGLKPLFVPAHLLGQLLQTPCSLLESVYSHPNHLLLPPHAFERRLRRGFLIHEPPGAGVPLHPVAVGGLGLRAAADGADATVVASRWIFRHFLHAP